MPRKMWRRTLRRTCWAPRRTEAKRCSSWHAPAPSGQRRNPRPTHACRPQRCPWATREGRAREGRGAGRGGESCGGRATGRGAALGLLGPGGASPPRHASTAAAAAVFAQLGTRWWGRNWAAQWHLTRVVGKRVRGCRAKRRDVYRALSCAIFAPSGPLWPSAE